MKANGGRWSNIALDVGNAVTMLALIGFSVWARI